MTYSSYTEACARLKWELIGSLLDESVNALREDCTILGVEGWFDWLEPNFEDVLKYVAASPSRRAQKKKWREQTVRGRLVLASIQHLDRAYVFLTAIDEYFVWQGLSYRDVAEGAGRAYIDVHSKKMTLWPFDDPNPFEDNP